MKKKIAIWFSWLIFHLKQRKGLFIFVLSALAAMALIGFIFTIKVDPPKIIIPEKMERSRNNQMTSELIISVEVINSRVKQSPLTVTGGEKYEIEVPDNQGFFVDGNRQAGAYAPYSDYAFLAMQMPDGKIYRLADKTSRLTVVKGGEVKFLVLTKRKGDYTINSGRNLSAQRLSEFRVEPITLYFRKVKEHNGQIMAVKEVDKNIFQINLERLMEDGFSKEIEKTEKMLETARALAASEIRPTADSLLDQLKEAEISLFKKAKKFGASILDQLSANSVREIAPKEIRELEKQKTIQQQRRNGI